MNGRSKYRWYSYGQPWGFFEKTNPKATPRSMARRALLYGVTYPWFFAGVMYLRDEPVSYWPVWLAGFAVLSMAFGALCEWQAVDQDAE
jgi:hypothetical protein